MLNEPAERGHRKHNIHIEGRERATITGVEELESFNDEEIVLITGMGALTVAGEGMHIDKLNLDDGQLIISGYIDALDYEDEAVSSGPGLFSRLMGR